MNFIIRILRYVTSTCSFVEPFETTCWIDIARFGNYEIHSNAFVGGDMFTMKRVILLSMISPLLFLLIACGEEEEIETETIEAKAENEEDFVEVSVKDAFYVALSNIEEIEEDEDKELLIVELDIKNTYSEDIRLANSQDVQLLDGDEEIDPITYVHSEFDIEREIDIDVDETSEHMVAFPVENNKTYDIALYPQVTIDAEEPVMVSLDTSAYADSYEELQNPAKMITAYVEEGYLDKENPDFDALVRENKDKIQSDAEKEFYKQLDRSSIHGFPEEDSEEIYEMFRSKLAEEASIDAVVRENIHGEAIVDFTYETLSLDKLHDLMEEYESEYHDENDGFDPKEANKYARSKIDSIIDALETVSGEWKIELVEKDGKWELDSSDFKSDALIDIFVNGNEYGE